MKLLAAFVLLAACSKDDCSSEQECFTYKERQSGRKKLSEAGANLDAIGVASKRAFKDNASFVVGKAAQLPAFKPEVGGGCCGGKGGTKESLGNLVNNKCTVDSGAFAADPVWKKLGFAPGEPTQYRYTYVGDATAFTATAVGDVDCDSYEATFQLVGTVDASGDPHLVATRPPAGVY